MYKIKMNPSTLDYEIFKDGQIIATKETKKEATKYVSELTNEVVIMQKAELQTEEKTEPKAEQKTEVKTEIATEQKPIEAEIKPIKKEASIFDLIGEKTEEDKGANSQFINEDEDEDEDEDENEGEQDNKLTEIARNLSAPDNEEEEDELSKKQSAKLTALLIVEMCGIVFSFLCQFIAKDFSKDAEKKYTLSTDKKKAIQNPLTKILELRKKKTSPVTSLVVAILLSFAPMIILAFADRRKKNEAEKEEAERKESANNLAQQQFNAYKENFLREQQMLASQKNILEHSHFNEPKEERAKIKFTAQKKEVSANGVRLNKDGSVAKKRGRKAKVA